MCLSRCSRRCREFKRPVLVGLGWACSTASHGTQTGIQPFWAPYFVYQYYQFAMGCDSRVHHSLWHTEHPKQIMLRDVHASVYGELEI